MVQIYIAKIQKQSVKYLFNCNMLCIFAKISEIMIQHIQLKKGLNIPIKGEAELKIEKSIISKEEEPLIGLGVLFEILWNKSNEETKLLILNNIKRGIVAN